MSSNSFRATANTGPRFEVYNRVADEMLPTNGKLGTLSPVVTDADG